MSAVRPRIDAALEHGLSNALIESVNTKIPLITRIAFGFRSATTLIALIMLSLRGHRPSYPGASNHGSVSSDAKYGGLEGLASRPDTGVRPMHSDSNLDNRANGRPSLVCC